MLVLTRKPNEQIWVDVESYVQELISDCFPGMDLSAIKIQPIRLSLVKIGVNSARIGIDSDERIVITRPEIASNEIREKIEQMDADRRRQKVAQGRDND